MRKPRTSHPANQEKWLESLLHGAAGSVRAPHGFAQRVMSAVYRESLAARPQSLGRSHSTALRLYRRIGLSFMLTAAVLAASLFVPHGAYTMLLGGGRTPGLGAGPSDAVQNVLLGAGHAVQGALGESRIGGDQE